MVADCIGGQFYTIIRMMPELHRTIWFMAMDYRDQLPTFPRVYKSVYVSF